MNFVKQTNVLTEDLVSAVEEVKDSIINDANINKSKLDIFKCSGSDLDDLVQNFGILRNSTSTNLQLTNIILIKPMEKLPIKVDIPTGTKFYINDSIYIETTTAYVLLPNINELLISGVLSVTELKSTLPASLAVNITSTSSIVNSKTLTAEIMRPIGSKLSDEDDENLKHRMINTLRYKGDNTYNKLVAVLNNYNINIYHIIDPNKSQGEILTGHIEIIICPPEMDRYKQTKTLLEAHFVEILKHNSLFVRIKEPKYCEIVLKNYDTNSIKAVEKYINNSLLGDTISLAQLKNAGASIYIEKDGVQMTSDLHLKYYEKARAVLFQV